jgi:hypothetical protein
MDNILDFTKHIKRKVTQNNKQDPIEFTEEELSMPLIAIDISGIGDIEIYVSHLVSSYEQCEWIDDRLQEAIDSWDEFKQDFRK